MFHFFLQKKLLTKSITLLHEYFQFFPTKNCSQNPLFCRINIFHFFSQKKKSCSQNALFARDAGPVYDWTPKRSDYRVNASILRRSRFQFQSQSFCRKNYYYFIGTISIQIKSLLYEDKIHSI